MPEAVMIMPGPGLSCAECVGMDEVRDALAMPEASLREICERIRTLRQTEMNAHHLYQRRRMES